MISAFSSIGAVNFETGFSAIARSVMISAFESEKLDEDR